MFKYTISIFLILLSLEARSNLLNLHPLCYSQETSCAMASHVLTLPPVGNFRVRSKCRMKTPYEISQSFCHNWLNVLDVQAFVSLPQIGQWVTRNQCFTNLLSCQHAAIIWNEVSHPNLNISALCSPFNRAYWDMPDLAMKKNGIFTCEGTTFVELKIRAKRMR